MSDLVGNPEDRVSQNKAQIVNGLMTLPLPDNIQLTYRISRYCHSMTFRQIHIGKDYYKYSFSLAIVQWNALQANVAASPSLDLY